jgi:hypothetical protein
MPLINRYEVGAKVYSGDYRELFDKIRDNYVIQNGNSPTDEYYHEINILINEQLFGVRNFGHNRKKNCTSEELNDHQNICRYIIECMNEFQNKDPKELIIAILEVY